MQLMVRIRQTANALFSFDLQKLSAPERAYCLASIKFYGVELCGWALATGIGFHFFSFFLDPFVAEPVTKPFLFWFHVVQLVLIPLGFLVPKSGRRFDRPLYCAIIGGINAAYYSFIIAMACQSSGIIILKSISVVLAMHIIFTLFSPYHGLFPIAFGVFQWLSMTLAVWGLPYSPALTLIYLMAMSCAVLFQKTVMIWTLRSAHMEFKCRIMLAPAHIVAAAVGHEHEIEERFKPERRNCVCISVQWRNYDRLALTMPPTKLANVLADYYDVADKLLSECIKGGAYYCDLMVDEMFIFVFEPDRRSEAQSYSDAVLFARRLLRERAGRSCAIAQIDVGISGGEVLVGVMGPEGHKKTTGLGEVPGRAARLKSAGLLIRDLHGDADRLVVDAPVYRMLAGQSGFKALRLDDERKIKDLDDEILYYWERKAA